MLTPAGLVPFTTIDFPNHLAGVVFFQGCPLRCPFCHNPNLQPQQQKTDMSWQDVLAFFEKRTKQLDGIVLSGGEPLMQPELITGLKQLRQMGFKTALHTSGVYPDRLKEALPLVDWIGLDIKAPWQKYALLTGRENLAEAVRKSLRLILEAQKPYEARTTLDPRYLTISDVYALAENLVQEGVQTYTLQKYRTFDLDKNPPSVAQIESFFEDSALMAHLKTLFPFFLCR